MNASRLGRLLATLTVAIITMPAIIAVAQPPNPLRASPTSSAQATSTGSPSAAKPSERLREGTRLIDVTGTFQSTGPDNISFLANGNKESFRALPNLALQRVSQSLEENRALRQWTISGTITEFRGANFLLITKAVIQLSETEAAGQ
jgi:hypothetical protein